MNHLTSCIKGGSSDRRPGWLLQFDYDRELVEILKRQVHHTGREWNAKAKTWWVAEEYEDILDILFSDWYSLAKQQGTLL